VPLDPFSAEGTVDGVDRIVSYFASKL